MLRFLGFTFIIPMILGAIVEVAACDGPERICRQIGSGAIFVFGVIGFCIFLATEREFR